METLYSNAVREYVQTRNWPAALDWVIVEKFDPYPFLQFVLYRENINTIDASDMLQVANTVNEMFMKLRNDGVPIYLEVARYA